MEKTDADGCCANHAFVLMTIHVPYLTASRMEDGQSRF